MAGQKGISAKDFSVPFHQELLKNFKKVFVMLQKLSIIINLHTARRNQASYQSISKNKRFSLNKIVFLLQVVTKMTQNKRINYLKIVDKQYLP